MDRLLERYVPQRFTTWFSEENDISQFAHIDEEDIDITLSDNILSIKGKREATSEEKNKDYYRAERSYGSFVCRVDLPSLVDVNKIDASVKKGVLAIHIKKSEKPKAKERKIKIHS